jgi:TRAP-type uncharacterized transport system substrate-binding protein
MDYNSIYISIIALGVSTASLIYSIHNMRKRRKSDQFNIALEIQDRLEKNAEKYTEIEIDSKNNSDNKDLYAKLKEDNAKACLNILEFFSFLINNKEIDNHNILKYFKPTFIDETDDIFKKYPDIANNKEMVKELRKLIDKFEKCKMA